MFESFEGREQSRGLKGFLAGHLGPARHAEQAEEELRKIALFFLSLATVSAILGVTLYGNTAALATGSILGIAAVVLYLSRSRIVSLILLVLLLANALLHLRSPFSWLWVLLAARTMQLAFGYQRLRGKDE